MMIHNKRSSIWLLVFLACFPLFAMSASPATLNVAKIEPFPKSQKLYDHYPWSMTYYYGYTIDDSLLRTTTMHNLTRWPENIQSLELTRTLNENNVIRRFFSPLVGVVQVNANVTLRNGRDQNRIIEFAPYINARWANLPWNDYVNTSFAFGEGISYASSVPSIEKRQNDNTKRLLNYLMLEATFAPPSHPTMQLVVRVHHRSGAYGLYRAGNSGSNDIGLGIRILLD